MRRAAAGVLACVLGAGCADPGGPPRATLSLSATLGGADTAGYTRAVEARAFRFPDDHGPHPDFRNEWWYVTGNLATAEGREVGFQLTLFRSALAPRAPAVASAWATNQAWMGHFAVTDVRGGRMHAFERFARESLGLAGAGARPFRVRVEDWSLEAETDSATFPVRARAAEGDVAVDLRLDAGKPVVLQGEGGLSRKGSGPGDASYYYSLTRLPAAGIVILGADTLHVAGFAWMDREWSTSALSEGQVGWDWFALQLDGGWELMAYVLRLADGSAHPLSGGMLVDPRGGRRSLAWGRDVTVAPTGRWTSPRDGAAYPSGWRITVPALGWELDVRPLLEDQELDLAFRYWEGAVRVEAAAGTAAPGGRGYVELTGYAGEAGRR